MMKNLVPRLLLLMMIFVSLNSCRTDEMASTTEQTQKEKIAFFARFENENILSKNATSSNYAIPFGNSMLAYFKNYPEKKIELENKYGTVDLRISSQDLDLDNGRKLLMFPMLTDGKVTAVMGGIVNAERDYLYFDVYKEGHPDRSYLIKTFQEYYDTKTVSKNDSNNPTNVGEVIIIVKKPQLTQPDPWDPTGGGHDMGGGSDDYSNGGGNPNPANPTNTDPCEQTKSMLLDQKVKDAVDDLKDHMSSGKGGEKGWKFNKDGNATETTENGPHSVVIGDPSLLNGSYHNHTGTKVDIFSATDIDTLLEIARYQSIGNTGNAFSGMVAPNGIHYVIHFNGSHSDLPPSGAFSEVDLEVLKISQYRNQIKLLSDTSGIYCNSQTGKLNSKGLEKLFMNTLKAMGLENKIILQRIDDDGIKTIKQNVDGTLNPVPCI
ncbi:hypothetical protein [Chryseobacterium vrystaatense]|uniref:Lipoprotein n=1 Tax=Chryseobacterium vrystaatense TaxID=307480 RepID=A0A1M5MBU1_9FLAO|nr:hypothetical protein [Chryseobacterium vrystaatense]SHG74681.1 hypothetical protein SAMN02787073_4788 [Chryseobacterium vrystaatense]